MVLGIHEILCFIAIAQLLLFSIVLITLKKGHSLSNALLSLFLFSKSLGIVNHLIFRLNIQNPHIYFILVPFAFLWGPSLYFYIKSLVYKDFYLKKTHILHLFPFLLANLYFVFVYHFQGIETKVEIISQTLNYSSMQQIIFVGILHIQIAFYMTASLRTLLKYRSKLKQHFSNLAEVSLPWLNIVFFGFMLIWIIDVAAFVLINLGIAGLSMNSTNLVLIFVFANIILYQGLRQPEIFSGIEEKEKYQQSPLSTKEKEQILEQLRTHMECEKPYLNPALSMNRLAKRLVVPPRYLSQVINEFLGINFYDFVNSYRVEEAKRLFLDVSNNHRNILELLFDAGFNTKSAFNRVFKKYTGMTPTEFKRTHQP